jgi:chromosome segregation ATPase
MFDHGIPDATDLREQMRDKITSLESEIAALKAENERLKKEKEYFYGRWRSAEETKSGLYKDIERLVEALKGGK